MRQLTGRIGMVSWRCEFAGGESVTVTGITGAVGVGAVGWTSVTLMSMVSRD